MHEILKDILILQYQYHYLMSMYIGSSLIVAVVQVFVLKLTAVVGWNCEKMKWLTLKGSYPPVLVYESLSMVLKWNSLLSTPLPWSPSHTFPPLSTVNLHDSWSDFGLACMSLVVCLLLHLCCLLPLRCLKFFYSWNGIWSGKSVAPL